MFLPCESTPSESFLNSSENPSTVFTLSVIADVASSYLDFNSSAFSAVSFSETINSSINFIAPVMNNVMPILKSIFPAVFIMFIPTAAAFSAIVILVRETVAPFALIAIV